MIDPDGMGGVSMMACTDGNECSTRCAFWAGFLRSFRAMSEIRRRLRICRRGMPCLVRGLFALGPDESRPRGGQRRPEGAEISPIGLGSVDNIAGGE